MWRREVWEPWDGRRQARNAGKELAPRPNPTAAELARAELIDSKVNAMLLRAAVNSRRPLSEWAREISMDEVRARHGR